MPVPPALPWPEVVGLAQKVRRVWVSLLMYEARTREIMSSVWGLGGLSNSSNISFLFFFFQNSDLKVVTFLNVLADLFCI